MPAVASTTLKQVKLLSKLHYALGGLLAALSMLTLPHIAVGLSFLSASQEVARAKNLPPQEFGLFIVIVGAFILLLGFIIYSCLSVGTSHLLLSFLVYCVLHSLRWF